MLPKARWTIERLSQKLGCHWTASYPHCRVRWQILHIRVRAAEKLLAVAKVLMASSGRASAIPTAKSRCLMRVVSRVRERLHRPRQVLPVLNAVKSWRGEKERAPKKGINQRELMISIPVRAIRLAMPRTRPALTESRFWPNQFKKKAPYNRGLFKCRSVREWCGM